MNRAFEFYGDHGQGDGNRHNGLLAHNLASQYCGRFSNSGSLAMLMANRGRPASRLIFVISVSERVPIVVLHNEARAAVIDRPRWR
jgi:hypothetical protein